MWVQRENKKLDLLSFMKSDFRLLEVTEKASVDYSNLMDDFCALVLKKEESYPEIGGWLEKKVIPQLSQPNRKAFVAYLDSRPVGTMIFKTGKSSKLCHLHVANDMRRKKIGEALITLMAIQLKQTAEEVYFTIPESVWADQEPFFSQFGFLNQGQASRQYRLFDRELFCSATSTEFLSASLRSLSELTQTLCFGPITQEPALVMSIRPSFARQIFEGKKTVEIRKRFSEKWVGHRITIYASKPEQALVGEATIKNVDTNYPQVIWERYGSEVGCDLAEFLKYCGDSNVVSAIILSEISRLDHPLKRSFLATVFNDPMVPPQSYTLLAKPSAWSNAASIASALGSHGRTDE